MQKNICIVLSALLCIVMLCSCSKGNEPIQNATSTLSHTLSTAIDNSKSADTADETDAKSTTAQSSAPGLSTASSKTEKKTTKANKNKPDKKEKNKSAPDKKNKSQNGDKSTTQMQSSDDSSTYTSASVVNSTESTTVISNSFTMTIECKSILNNMDNLKKGHESYIPKNGMILSDYSVPFKDSMTAYDLLCKACDDNNISVSAEETSFGIYVSGINNIDEFDCGKQSGWTYYVNGKMPNVACSKYKLNKGDKVSFSYTCSYK